MDGDADMMSDMYDGDDAEDTGDIEEGIYGEDDEDMMSLLQCSVDGDYVDRDRPNGKGSLSLVRPTSYPRQERVKMIHLRSYLEKVKRRVEAKQEIVNKFKEQLKTCKQNIERLEAEEEDTKAGIEKESDAGRMAAVFRLRAQLTRVELEKEGEYGLRDHIESNLEDAQYDLTLAQIEQGKYLVAEAQLDEKEVEYKEHQHKLAEYRQNKERHYTRMAERELIRREEQLQEARDMQIQQERLNKQRMKEAHERHNRFLQSTMNQIRAEKSREEQEYRDELERKIKSVLNLKHDISKNRENLTALAAKDRAMNRAERQREDFLHTSVATEGGNADLALLREQRIQQHQAKREVFEAKQRQKEIEIAAKILMEEERMKKRKAQMPYLFDNPKASKSQRVKPHRRRKLQIEKEAERQIDLLDHPEHARSPSLLLDPDREYSDLDSPIEDDDDDAQTNSIDKYAERLVKEEQERPSDTLAQPEFEGLWDKHRAYTVPTEGKVPTNGKLAGLSKMEQDIMGRVLDQTKANIVVKQVAAGREFSGQAFYSKPDIIHFKDFEVGKTYKKRVVLTNVSYTVNYCKLVGLTELLKDFIELSFDPPGQLSAGMTCDLHVTFSPKINEDLIGEVNFMAQTGPFSIPLHCTTKKCDLSLDRTLIDFGTTVIGESLRRTFVLRNRGAKGTRFELSRVHLDRRASRMDSSTPTATVEEAEPESQEAEGEGNEESDRTGEEDEGGKVDGEGESEEHAEDSTGTEPEADAAEEASAEAVAEEAEEEEYGMQIVGVSSGEIGPFSEVRLELSWSPELPDDLVRSDFRVQFDDPASEELALASVGVAVDVPVWVERQTVDLRLCMLDRLYQDTVVVCNRASTALRLKFEVCPALKNYMELLPKTGYIQAHSSFSAQLKFMPRATLMDELRESALFDPQTGLLEVPMTIRVADQTRPVQFMVQAVVTPTDIRFDKSEMDFGFATIHESAVMPLQLINTSILPQKFGFVGLPDFVEVQPNDGFGTLLPLETIQLDVIFSPGRAKDYKFELVCKSLIGRTFTVPCCGVGVHPPLHLSQQVVHFPSTTLEDINTAHVHVVNAHTSMNQYSHPVPRIGSKGEIVPVGPTSFEFRVPPDAPISISPCVGTVLPGKRCRVEVRFKPSISDSEIRDEACRLVRVKKEAEAMAEYQKLLEEERLAAEEAEKTASRGGKKAGPPKSKQDEKSTPSKKGKTPTSKSGGRREEEAPLDGPRPVTVPPPESLEAEGDEVASGKVSLTRQFAGEFSSFQIPCFVASGKCATGCEESPSSVGANTLYLEVHCPSVRPELVVLSGTGRRSAKFGAVSVGTTVNRPMTLQNISGRPLSLRASCLDPNGPFNLVNALRTLEPGASHTLLLSFAPSAERQYREQLVIDAGHSKLRLVVSGEGVRPSLELRQTDDCEGDIHILDLGAVIAGEYIERFFTLENTSALAIDFEVRLDSVSLLRHQEAQHVPVFVRRHRVEGGVTGRLGGPHEAQVGLQNFNGQAVFDCVPSAGTIPSGESLEVTVTFAPDHSNDHFADTARIILFNHEHSHVVRLRGKAKPHIMFLEGGDTLGPDVGSLSALAVPPTDEEVDPALKGGIGPSSALLLTFGAQMDEEGHIESATRSALIGCVRTMAVSQKKNGEFTFDNPAPLAALGFSVDPIKGQVEAGVRKRVKFTWTPPQGHDPNKPVEGSIMVTLRGDVVEQFKIILRAMVVSDQGVIINDIED